MVFIEANNETFLDAIPIIYIVLSIQLLDQTQ